MKAPSGWVEVFNGPSLAADVMLAVLEASGLHPVAPGGGGWPSVFSGLDDGCPILVPAEEAELARTLIAEASGTD